MSGHGPDPASDPASDEDELLRELGIAASDLALTMDRRPILNADPGQREAVACALIKHRYADRLGVGDPIPELWLRELDGDGRVPLRGLGRSRPVLLAFGSYT